MASLTSYLPAEQAAGGAERGAPGGGVWRRAERVRGDAAVHRCAVLASTHPNPALWQKLWHGTHTPAQSM